MYNKHFLQVIYFFSFSLGLFWTSGVVLDEMLKGPDLDWKLVLVLSISVVAFISSVISRKNPSILTIPEGTVWWKPILILSLFACIWYIVLAPAFWWLGHLLISKCWPDPQHSQAGVYKLLLALWLPAWWAPGLGAVSYYFLLKKK